MANFDNNLGFEQTAQKNLAPWQTAGLEPGMYYADPLAQRRGPRYASPIPDYDLYNPPQVDVPDIDIPALDLPAVGTEGFSDIAQQEFIRNLLPQFTEYLSRELPQITLPEFTRLPEETMTQQLSLLGTLKDLGIDVSGEGEYVPTEAITLPDIEQDPAFQAFRENLGVQTQEAAEALINEMARRGITVSSATEEGYGDIADIQQRAIASEIGRLQSPLVRESILQQAIEEPQRRSAFNTMIANRMLGLGMSERDIMQLQEAERARFATENLLRREQRARDIANLPIEQELLIQNLLGQRLNLPLSVMTGIPYAEQGALAREQLEASERSAREQREALRDIQREQRRSGLVGAGLGFLGDIGAAYLSSDRTLFSDLGGWLSGLFDGGGSQIDFGGELGRLTDIY